MQEAVFYRLYQAYQAKEERYIPVHEFMGEIYVKELSKWGYVSYECSARLSEMHKANPGLLQRTYLTGKSGAHFYGYRITPGARPELIKDERLVSFHKRIRPKPKPVTREATKTHDQEVDEAWNILTSPQA